MSDDGSSIAFLSSATNLVAGDTNGHTDVFVSAGAGPGNSWKGTTERVSVATSGAQANAPSGAPSISDDGNLVAFASTATNLVAGDTNGQSDVFVRDLAAATTVRVATGTLPTLSGDGTHVVYRGIDGEVHVVELATGTVTDTGLPESYPEPFAPSISDDGAYVALVSELSLYRHNMLAGTSELIETMEDPDLDPLSGRYFSGSPLISGDGMTVAYVARSYVRVSCAPFSVFAWVEELLVVDFANASPGIETVESRSFDPCATGGIVLPPWPFQGIRLGGISDDGQFIAAALSRPYPTIAFDAMVVDRDGGTVNVGKNTLGTLTSTADAVNISGAATRVAFSTEAALFGNDTNSASDIVARAFPEPTVSTITPNVVNRGTSTTLTVHGTYLESGLTATITGGPGVQVDAINVVSGTETTIEVTVATDAPIGARWLTLCCVGADFRGANPVVFTVE